MRIDRILIFVFLISALTGIYTSYDHYAAITKFGVLAISVLIFFIVSTQPGHRKDILSTATTIIGLLISIYFLLSHDWYRWPVDYAIISKVAGHWMDLRPQMGFVPVHPNFIGGTIAILLPLSTIEVIQSSRKNNRWRFCAALLALIIQASSLLLTSSRASWAALVVSTTVVGMFWVSKVTKISKIVAMLLGAIVLLITLNAVSIEMDPINWFMSIPGAMTRSELLGNSALLAKGFLFTGGGLGAFPGLYSRYILAIPVVFLDYSHNLYLDLIIEQGIFGFTAFLLLMAVALFWVLGRVKRANSLDNNTLLSLAVLVGLLVILIHGLIDDALYGGSGNPLLFFLPAWAAFLHASSQSDGAAIPTQFRKFSGWKYVAVAVLLPLCMLAVVQSKRLGAALVSNIGSVWMAEIDLSGFPDSLAEDRSDRYPDRLQEIFETSLRLDPDQLPAHYRLGLIALEEMDFQQSIERLEKAYELNPNHRGVVKNLGYAFVWHGNLTAALPFLAKISEAKTELTTYSWWWESQGEHLLAERSALAASELQ